MLVTYPLIRPPRRPPHRQDGSQHPGKQEPCDDRPDTGITSKVLPEFMQHQQQSNWCWSADGTSVGLLFETGSWTQCGTANGCLTRSDCCDSPVPGPCNVYGYLDKSLTFTRSFNRSFGGTTGGTEIQGQIDQGFPVCVRVAWTGGGAHFLAITGYSFPDADPSAFTIYLQDSIYGATTMLLSDFPASYHGGGTWTHTYLTQPNP